MKIRRNHMYWFLSALALVVLFLTVFMVIRKDHRQVIIDPDVEVIQGEPDFGEGVETETYNNTDLNFTLKYPTGAEFNGDESDFSEKMATYGNYNMYIIIQLKDPRDMMVELTIGRSEYLFQNAAVSTEQKVNSIIDYVDSTCFRQNYIKNVQLNSLVGFKVECIPSPQPAVKSENRYPPKYFFEKDGWVYKFDSIPGSAHFTNEDEAFFKEFLKGFSLQ